MNFKEMDNQETELYNPEASAERLKEIMRQEERRKDKKAIPYFIGVILLGIFIWWLCTERTEEISITHTGYFFADSDSFNKSNLMEASTEPLALTVEGKVTYSSKISKKIVYLDLTVTLKDSNGNVVFEGSGGGNCQFGYDGKGSVWMREYIYEDDGISNFIDLGNLCFTKDFKEVYLRIEEGTLYFAAPATSVEEAYEIFYKVNGFTYK